MMSNNKPHATDTARVPISNAKPSNISSAHNTMAIVSANPFKKVIWKTSKYSSSLYENPSGSFAFISPENMKSNPTNILAAHTHHVTDVLLRFLFIYNYGVKVVVVEKVSQF